MAVLTAVRAQQECSEASWQSLYISPRQDKLSESMGCPTANVSALRMHLRDCRRNIVLSLSFRI